MLAVIIVAGEDLSEGSHFGMKRGWIEWRPLDRRRGRGGRLAAWSSWLWLRRANVGVQLCSGRKLSGGYWQQASGSQQVERVEGGAGQQLKEWKLLWTLKDGRNECVPACETCAQPGSWDEAVEEEGRRAVGGWVVM